MVFCQGNTEVKKTVIYWGLSHDVSEGKKSLLETKLEATHVTFCHRIRLFYIHFLMRYVSMKQNDLIFIE